jgi:hypothetical protein
MLTYADVCGEKSARLPRCPCRYAPITLQVGREESWRGGVGVWVHAGVGVGVGVGVYAYIYRHIYHIWGCSAVHT